MCVPFYYLQYSLITDTWMAIELVTNHIIAASTCKEEAKRLAQNKGYYENKN